MAARANGAQALRGIKMLSAIFPFLPIQNRWPWPMVIYLYRLSLFFLGVCATLISFQIVFYRYDWPPSALRIAVLAGLGAFAAHRYKEWFIEWEIDQIFKVIAITRESTLRSLALLRENPDLADYKINESALFETLRECDQADARVNALRKKSPFFSPKRLAEVYRLRSSPAI
jgi:hypothetical protein